MPVYIGDAHALASHPERADGQSSLPFPSVVNWSSLVIFADSLSCLAGGGRITRALARQLEELEQQTPPEEFRRQCETQLAGTFSRYLSFIRRGRPATTGR